MAFVTRGLRRTTTSGRQTRVITTLARRDRADILGRGAAAMVDPVRLEGLVYAPFEGHLAITTADTPNRFLPAMTRCEPTAPATGLLRRWVRRVPPLDSWQRDRAARVFARNEDDDDRSFGAFVERP